MNQHHTNQQKTAQSNLASSGQRWYGSLVPAPAYHQTEGYRPVLAIWLEGTSVLASELVHPEDGENALVRTLRRALKQNKRPNLLAVESEALALSIGNYTEDISLTVAQDSFLPVVAHDQMSLMPALCEPNTYFEADIQAEHLRPFFSAMAEFAEADLLHRDDSHFISVHFPSLGIENGILWVGSDSYVLGHGFRLFPTVAAYREWILVNFKMTHEWSESDDQRNWSGQFQKQRWASKVRQNEVRQTRLSIHGKSYPKLYPFDSEGIRRPLRPADYCLATLVATGIATLQEAMRDRSARDIDITIAFEEDEHTGRFQYPAVDISQEDRDTVQVDR